MATGNGERRSADRSNMTRRSVPLILDLFCCEGGAATGYYEAGFEVVGVDIEPQPRYPFTFHQANALEVLEAVRPSDFDAVHASPPCQASTTMSNRWRGQGGKADAHVNLIAEVRELLIATGLPYVIENVPGARSHLRDAMTLTGGMFGLKVHRPRLFESNVLLMAPPAAPAPADSIGVYGKAHDGRLLWRRKDGTEQRAASSLEEAQEAMGMPWASWRGCAEAIPPAYTEHLGRLLIAHIGAGVAA